jgi:class 3 adenylate cyclase/tetratricopeptide (TPR) repeat protein
MAPSPTLHFGPFSLDGTGDGLWCGPERCTLTAKAEAVLRSLVAHPGRLVRKADLLAAVWPDAHVSDWVLTTCIRELRHVLGDVARSPRYIATVHRQGYRFVAPVTVVTTPPLLSVPAVLPQPLHAAPPACEAPQAASTAAALEEEHKLVTILCGALAEAPALAARLGPERWYRLLQTVGGLAQEVLQHYAGTLTLATGDGFTAVFGAPVAQEDHARRAVLAALELRQRLQDAPALHTQYAGGTLTLGMGLHSGLVVVGWLGQDPQRLATAVGAPLYMATRLQQQSAPGAILLSAATYQLVHAEIQATPCGTLAMDGQPTPVSVYAVQGLLRRHAGVAGRGSRALSPFVGRERELALLHDHLAMAMAGQGQVVGLVGEPGMGKTRLVTEFCRRVPGDQVTVYVGQCLSYGQSTPYLPVRDLVRQVCGLAEGDAAAFQTAALQHRLHASGITAEEDVALLLHLLDLPVAPEYLAWLSPEARQVRTFALLRHLVVHTAQPQPLVLVVENVHWSDPTSAAWLLSLVERLPGTAILLVGTCRPGSPLPWGAHAAGTQVALSPLRDPDSRAVVQAVLGAAVLPDVRLRALLAQARGNPFFLEEFAWHAVEHDQPDALDAVPETVQAVLAARMDRLPPSAKWLLQVAAVIGMDVAFPLLQALAAQPEEQLQQSLAHLQAAAFLYETRLVPEPAYTFKHALTQEVAYHSLLLERRRVLHAHLVEAIEALAPERVAEHVDRLAYHAIRGQVWGKALTYCQQAGAKALAGSAYREAVGYFESALEALPHLPSARPMLEQAIDLRLNLCSALGPLAQHERMLAYLHEAETLSEELADQRRLGRVYRGIAPTLRNMYDYESALTYCQRAHALATALGDVDTQIWLNYFMSQIYFDLGGYHQAMECMQQMLITLQGMPPDPSFRGFVSPSVQAYTWMVSCLRELGEFADGAAYGEDALQIAERAGRPNERLAVYRRVGHLHMCQGTLHQAIPLLERAMALSQDVDIPVVYRLSAAYLALAYALAGRVTDALTTLEQVGETTELPITSLTCEEAYLRAGCVEEAQQQTQRELAKARQRHMRGQEARALWLLGEIAMRRDPPDVASAEVHYQQALALAEALGMRPLQAHCHLGLGTLYATTDQRQQARAELSTAVEMYRAMAMTLWLPQAEAALAQIG